MQLPGGLVEGDTRRRDWAFRPVSGELELAVAEAGETSATMPHAVTRALTVALRHLAGAAPNETRVADLCVGDRQFLMRELDRHLGSEGGWFEADCPQCGQRFDFEMAYADLPVQEAGPGFPCARVDMEGRQFRFRLPTGADQQGLTAQPEARAQTWLLGRLIQEGEIPEVPGQDLIAAAEGALESIAPGIVSKVQAACPSCGTINEVELDPYRVLSRRTDSLLQEVHQIALHYHWSEADILRLPRPRRLQYMRLIDRARGMAA
jgi:hypothetical protein